MGWTPVCSRRLFADFRRIASLLGLKLASAVIGLVPRAARNSPRQLTPRRQKLFEVARHSVSSVSVYGALASTQASGSPGPALQERLNAATSALAEELSAFCREVGAPLEIRHFASLWRVGWLEDHPLQDLLFAMMRSRGVHILDNFPCFLTTAHSEADIRLVATAFKDSVRELQESEFLPRRASPVAVAFDASKPPVPGARLGKDASGKPAWFVPNPDEPGRYLKVGH